MGISIKARTWTLIDSRTHGIVISTSNPDDFVVEMNEFFELSKKQNPDFGDSFYGGGYDVTSLGYNPADFLVAMWHMSFFAPSMSSDAERVVRDWYKPSPSVDTLDAFFISDDETTAQMIFVELLDSYGLTAQEIASNMRNEEAIGNLFGGKSFVKAINKTHRRTN